MHSPVQFLPGVSRALNVPVWIKREDLLKFNSIGGSKVRKLRAILSSARSRAATDLVTIGTTGSHHVHAACILGQAAGLKVHAVLLPQPDLPYANAVHEKTKAAGSELTYAPSPAGAMLRAAGLYGRLTNQGRNVLFVFPGGTGVDGVSAYREAGLELKTDLETIRRSGGEIDFQVCVYGTGGIAAGLYAAGRLERSLPAVYAVQVYPGFWNSKFYIRSLAMLARRSHGTSQENPAGPVCVPPAAPGLYTPSGYIGDGYGTENPGCREAVDLFEMDGIFFDPVYMARAGQAVIDLARSRKPRGLLLWYTSPGRAV